MIGPGTGVRVYLASGVTDMRKGILGLAMLAQTVLRQQDSKQPAPPFSPFGDDAETG